MKETIEHNNRFYGEELKTESEQLKEWLIVANKEIERLTKQNKALNEMYELTKKEYIRLNNIINELEKWCLSWKENDKYCYLASNDKDKCRYDIWEEVLDKLHELKGENKKNVKN